MAATPVTLTGGETTVLVVRRHPWAFVPSAIRALLLLVLAAILFLVGTAIDGSGGFLAQVADTLLGLLTLAVAVAGGAWTIALALRWRSYQVVLTSRRIVRIEGLGRRETAALPLDAVGEVVRNDGALGARLGYGDLLVRDGAGHALALRDIRRPAAVRDAIAAAQEAFAREQAAAREAAEAEAALAEGRPPEIPGLADELAGTAAALGVPVIEPEDGPSAGYASSAPDADAAAAARAARTADADAAVKALATIVALRDAGTISDEDFAAKKRELLDRI